MGIGALISVAASIYQAVKAYNAPEPKTEKLFANLDIAGKGAIESGDLQNAFDKIAVKASEKADQLFAKLDTDSDGKVTQQEFSSSINRLVEQLDDHYMRMRVHGPESEKLSFSKDDIANLGSTIASNFDKADSNGDGRISVREAAAFGKTQQTAGAPEDRQNVELMLQVVRLMQTYGSNAVAKDGGKGGTVSVSA